jgi:DNA-binding NarL/FixJ family response regulator
MGSVEYCRRAEGLLRRLGRRAPTKGQGEARGSLTARELEVLRLIVDGRSNRGIAEALVISEATAARHVFNIFCKLGVHTRAQAVRAALDQELLA